jgi:hypothetical protein
VSTRPGRAVAPLRTVSDALRAVPVTAAPQAVPGVGHRRAAAPEDQVTDDQGTTIRPGTTG